MKLDIELRRNAAMSLLGIENDGFTREQISTKKKKKTEWVVINFDFPYCKTNALYFGFER